MNRRNFYIWFGAALLLGMLGTCYIAINAVYYADELPRFPEGYAVQVLSPSQE